MTTPSDHIHKWQPGPYVPGSATNKSIYATHTNYFPPSLILVCRCGILYRAAVPEKINRQVEHYVN